MIEFPRQRKAVTFLLGAAFAGLGLVLACGGPTPTGEGDAPDSEPLNQARIRQRVEALERGIERQEQLVDQVLQQQHEQIDRIEESTRQMAEELNALKAELRMPMTPIGPRVPPVPDEAGPATPSGGETTGAEAAAGRSSTATFLLRIFYVLVLIAVGFLIYKYAIRWQEYEPEPEDDDRFETAEGTISLSPEARRKSGVAPPEDGANKPDDADDADDADDEDEEQDR
jgi:hypothetical protein